MWNLYWTGVRLPSPPLMKTKIIFLSLCLILIAPDLIRRNKALLFLIDGRPKQIMYCNVSFKLVHIDIEVIEPEIRKDHAAFQSMNIFSFLQTLLLFIQLVGDILSLLKHKVYYPVRRCTDEYYKRVQKTFG